jgi:hypothetical protein
MMVLTGRFSMVESKGDLVITIVADDGSEDDVLQVSMTGMPAQARVAMDIYRRRLGGSAVRALASRLGVVAKVVQ